MKRIFVDTSALLALEDESDVHHAEALRFRDQVLFKGNYELITTSYILDETLTRRRLGIRESIALSKKIRASRILKSISVSGETEEKALDLFEKYDDKTFSFTDCVSFVAMHGMQIREAFAFDDHFSQMGFQRKP